MEESSKGIQKKTRRGRPVSVDNVIYSSLSEAARKLRKSPNTIKNRSLDPKWPTYFFVNLKK